VRYSDHFVKRSGRILERSVREEAEPARGNRDRDTSPPNIAELLSGPFRILVDELHEGLAEAGYPDIRPAHGNVFGHIRKEGSRLTELAERAQLTKQTMGYLVDYLEERGYVGREPDPGDKRAKIVRLTDDGRELIGVAREIMGRIEARWVRLLGEDRMEQLRELLTQLNTLAGKRTSR
jgi:DNA-binding MarR family transcriptional regulator